MDIAISQQDIAVPLRAWPGDALERSWHFFLHKHRLIPIANTGKIPEQLHCDAVVLSGGSFGVWRVLTEVELIKFALAHEIPLIGVCHGAFVINEYFGGVNGTVSGHNGPDHDIVMEDKKFTVNSYHNLDITRLASDFIPVAQGEINIEAFRHKNKSIWGLVWHPERQIHPVLPTALAKLLT